MRKKELCTLMDTSYELDCNPGDVSSIFNFADDLLNDIEQLIFGFCVSLNRFYPCCLYRI